MNKPDPRQRAKNSWRDWDAKEIKEELAPWKKPMPYDNTSILRDIRFRIKDILEHGQTQKIERLHIERALDHINQAIIHLDLEKTILKKTRTMQKTKK